MPRCVGSELGGHHFAVRCRARQVRGEECRWANTERYEGAEAEAKPALVGYLVGLGRGYGGGRAGATGNGGGLRGLVYILGGPGAAWPRAAAARGCPLTRLERCGFLHVSPCEQRTTPEVHCVLRNTAEPLHTVAVRKQRSHYILLLCARGGLRYTGPLDALCTALCTVLAMHATG